MMIFFLTLVTLLLHLSVQALLFSETYIQSIISHCSVQSTRTVFPPPEKRFSHNR